MAKKMWWLKMGAVAAIAILFVAGLGPRRWALVWAQLPTPNPFLAPMPPPAAPAQLPAPITTAIAPSLAPVPTPPAASPTPSTRNFACSCYGPATHTNWMGQVFAPNYFTARQAALQACLAYNQNRAPESPFLNPNAFGATRPPAVSGAMPPGMASLPGQPYPGTLNFSTQAQLQNCSNCACD